jgi:hypothetical protein
MMFPQLTRIRTYRGRLHAFGKPRKRRYYIDKLVLGGLESVGADDRDQPGCKSRSPTPRPDPDTHAGRRKPKDSLAAKLGLSLASVGLKTDRRDWSR